MFEDLIVGFTDLDKGSRVAEFPCLLRNEAVKTCIKILSKISQSIGMLYGMPTNYIEYVDRGSESFRKRDRIGSRVSSRPTEVSSIENPLEGKGRSRRVRDVRANGE